IPAQLVLHVDLVGREQREYRPAGEDERRFEPALVVAVRLGHTVSAFPMTTYRRPGRSRCRTRPSGTRFRNGDVSPVVPNRGYGPRPPSAGDTSRGCTIGAMRRGKGGRWLNRSSEIGVRPITIAGPRNPADCRRTPRLTGERLTKI